MKKRNLLLALATLALVLPAGASAGALQTLKPEEEVLKVVSTLFEGMQKKDTALMRSTLASGARLISTQTINGQPAMSEVPIETWMSSVARSQSALEEKIFSPEVRIADNLATVWTRYELHVNGAMNHCGYDAFQLVRTSDGWKIVHIADTRTPRQNCT